jgi:hypothetical protein
MGEVNQALIYFAPIFMVIRPLWLDWIMTQVDQVIPAVKGLWWSFQQPETKVTIGWLFWVPAVLGIRVLKKKNAGPGLQAALPFLILLGIAIWYLGIKPHWVQHFLQAWVPFMAFFRVASRWGLFLPQIVTILIVLSWPELSRWLKTKNQTSSNKWKLLCGLFVGLSIAESTWLLRPPVMMTPFSDSMTQFLENIRKSPGTAVLDMPFCTLGGNEICSHQCPSYPYSTAGACFRQWHDKDVYGIYQSRMVLSQCETYAKQPYVTWLQAWRANRCFTPDEWKDLCSYLDQHSELSAILVYPELWSGSQTPECQAQWKIHLGNPIDESSFYGDGNSGGQPRTPIRVMRFSPRCSH